MMKRVIYILRALCISLLFSTYIAAQIDTILICKSNELAFLEARIGQFAYQWFPTEDLTNPTIFNPTATPNENTLYVAKMIPSLIGENLIQNPDFSEGNVGFTSDYPFVESINTQGVYGIDESAKNLNGGFFTACPDHTTGDGLMMVVDGSPTPNERVWCQTIEVEAQKGYAFSAWLTSVNSRNPAQLQFSINGERLGDVFQASANTCEWRQFFEVWETQTATTAEICIVNRNTNPQGNDFALDDFAFYEVQDIVYDSVQVIISDLAIDSVFVQLPDCGLDNGRLEIAAIGNLGEVTYRLNNEFSPSNSVFQNIGVGDYLLQLTEVFQTTENEFICSIEQTKTVVQKPCPIYIPNIFSPNDDQQNDTFFLQSDPDFRGQLQSVTIYDRWGNQVFEAQHLSLSDFQWNGFSSAEPLMEGIYIYVIIVEYEDGSSEVLSGEVSLVR